MEALDIHDAMSLLLAHHLFIANLIVDLLKRLAGVNLREKEGGEHAQEVDSSEDTEGLLKTDTVRVAVGRFSFSITVLRGVKETEGADDGTSLAEGGTDSVGGASDGGREDLGRVDEGGGVGTPVGEEEGEAVENQETRHVLGHPVVPVAGEEGEEGGHEEEAHHLDLPAAHVLDGENSHPVARNDGSESHDSLSTSVDKGVLDRSDPAGAGLAAVKSRGASLVAGEGSGELDVELVGGSSGIAGNVNVTDEVVGRELTPVDGGVGNPADGGVDVGLEETLGVEGDIEEEPRHASAEELNEGGTVPLGLSKLELRVVREVVLADENLHVGLDGSGVLLDVKGVAGGLRKPGAGIHGEGGRKGTEHEHSSPDVVTVLGALLNVAEASGHDKYNGVGNDVASALHGEHRGDEGATVSLGAVLGHDDSGEGIVTTDTHTKQEAEEKKGGHDSDTGAPEGETLHEGEGDHHGKGDTVDGLAADLVTKVAEENLTAEGADQGDGVDTGVEGKRKAAIVVDEADELGDLTDHLKVVTIGEETHASDDDGLDVEPRELGIVKGVEDGETGLEMISHDGDRLGS